ncbi:hypothetical protein ACRRTK_015272 [Alexandromys fortis]
MEIRQTHLKGYNSKLKTKELPLLEGNSPLKCSELEKPPPGGSRVKDGRSVFVLGHLRPEKPLQLSQIIRFIHSCSQAVEDYKCLLTGPHYKSAVQHHLLANPFIRSINCPACSRWQQSEDFTLLPENLRKFAIMNHSHSSETLNWNRCHCVSSLDEGSFDITHFSGNETSLCRNDFEIYANPQTVSHRSLSWQLLDVFQRREILKPKKEINASKLPAGSPERCLIQEAEHVEVSDFKSSSLFAYFLSMPSPRKFPKAAPEIQQTPKESYQRRWVNERRLL